MAYYRKVIKVKATDSPNVRFALAEIAAGKQPSDRILVPGVLPWSKYQYRRATWDAMKQQISLDAEFYEDRATLLFPPDWLNHGEQVWERISRTRRVATGMGVDTAEGGDKSCWAVCDSWGLIELVSVKTPDTSVIPAWTLDLLRKYNLKPERCCFDRGGGGKEHADRLRALGHKVRTVGFGESVNLEPKHGMQHLHVRKDVAEERYSYKNRRGQMYGDLSCLFDPITPVKREGIFLTGFALPPSETELRFQLSVIPRWYSEEGQLIIPPKHRKAGEVGKSEKVYLDTLIGHSPDEADAVALAGYAMLHPNDTFQARAFGRSATANKITW